jgi:hypothetical protein
MAFMFKRSADLFPHPITDGKHSRSRCTSLEIWESEKESMRIYVQSGNPATGLWDGRNRTGCTVNREAGVLS